MCAEQMTALAVLHLASDNLKPHASPWSYSTTLHVLNRVYSSAFNSKPFFHTTRKYPVIYLRLYLGTVQYALRHNQKSFTQTSLKFLFSGCEKINKTSVSRDLQECFNGFQGMSGFRRSCLFCNPCGMGRVVGVKFPHVWLLIPSSGWLQTLRGIALMKYMAKVQPILQTVCSCKSYRGQRAHGFVKIYCASVELLELGIKLEVHQRNDYNNVIVIIIFIIIFIKKNNHFLFLDFSTCLKYRINSRHCIPLEMHRVNINRQTIRKNKLYNSTMTGR